MRRNVDNITRERAKRLRKNLTRPEKILWSKLRAKQILGLHARRQHPIGPYIADFCFESVKLVVEIDSGYHDFRQNEDKSRDQYFAGLGYKVIRISSHDVMKNLENVVEWIRCECEQRM